MKEQIETLARLASLRGSRVQEMLGRVNYQRNLCQRYRNNITGLTRLCGFSLPVNTSLQRSNQQQYKVTLYKMLELQRRELGVAEQMLARIQGELLQAMRNEKVITQLIDSKMGQWQELLARQEQKIQDGLAAQAWWRAQVS
ncbi:flagellar export protein FliJ [Pseudomonas alcaligenes]|uniref:Flagellar FliJ protein n=1 Tax=Aquipseudomonas alcaligenes TaxID=43263 RepID=A0ABR7RYK5_AQUAC|nr:flagellar FliJ family protein [Pseudomonas alcaligenes]MBC9249832.1 flagellar export protein FliJ [Pseudomonas alcaligenes]